MSDVLREVATRGWSIERDELGRIVVARRCTVTGRVYSVSVDVAAYERWLAGVHSQDCFPDLTAEQREFLISTLTPAEFDRICGEEEDI